MRALTTASASAMMLSLVGCGGDSGSPTGADVAKSKDVIKSASQDSMKAYLETRNQPAKGKHK